MNNVFKTFISQISFIQIIVKKLALGIFLTSMMWSCDVVGEIAGFEEPPFEDPAEIPRDNPVDPQNDAGNQYNLVLQANLVSTISQNGVLEGDDFRVNLVPTETLPSAIVAQVRYTLQNNEIPNYLPPVEFTSLAEAGSVALLDLDEGNYTFTYAYRIQGFNETVGEPIQFTVNAIQGPGIYFFKKRTETVGRGQSLTFQVWLDEIEDIAGVSVAVVRTSSVNLIQNVTFTPYQDSRSILFTNSNSRFLSFIRTPNTNFDSFHIEIARTDEQPSTAIQRSGPIGEVTITTLNTAGEMDLTISPSLSILRNSRNTNVPIGQTGSKTIIVQ